VFTSSTRYAYNLNLTRSAYVDGTVLVDFWNQLYRSRGIEAIEAEALRGIRNLFGPNVTVPQPTKTFFFSSVVHWGFKAGSASKGITTDSVFAFAQNPLPNTYAKCKLHLPTDTWAARYAGWAFGGWRLSIQWLRDCHAIVIDDAEFGPCRPYTAPPLSRTWCDCNVGTLPRNNAGATEYVRANCPNKAPTVVTDNVSTDDKRKRDVQREPIYRPQE
jgi:hypothetical protein